MNGISCTEILRYLCNELHMDSFQVQNTMRGVICLDPEDPEIKIVAEVLVNGETKILKVTTARTTQILASRFRFVQCLGENGMGIPARTPVDGQECCIIRLLDMDAHVVLETAVSGEPCCSWQQLARLLAQIHRISWHNGFQIGTDWQIGILLPQAHLEEQIGKLQGRISGTHEELLQRIRVRNQWLMDRKSHWRKGAIQGDLTYDNVVQTDQGPVILDFDQASDGCYAEEAAAVCACCYDGRQDFVRHSEDFFRIYTEGFPLLPEELEDVYPLAQLAADIRQIHKTPSNQRREHWDGTRKTL